MTIPLNEELKPFLTPAFQRKPLSVNAINVSELTSYTDVVIIVEAASRRQVTSLAEHMIKMLKAQNINAIGIEGTKEGEWALLDYGDTVIHIFGSETRALYDLEGFWSDAPRIDLSEFESLVEMEDGDEF